MDKGTTGRKAEVGGRAEGPERILILPSLLQPGVHPGEESHPWDPALDLFVLIIVPLISTSLTAASRIGLAVEGPGGSQLNSQTF